MGILNRAIVLSSAATAALTLAPAASQARIVRVEITDTQPAFGGRSFGEVGPYERVIGKAYGEVDPQQAPNAMIQDTRSRRRTPRAC